MARPERFELPTTWFEEVTVEIQPNRNSKLDGPPSPISPSNIAESRWITAKSYVMRLNSVPLSIRCTPETSRSN